MRSKYKKLLYIVLTIIPIFLTSTIFGGKLSINPTGWNIYEGCYQPYQILMDTDNNSINAVDTKLYLNNIFSLNPNTLEKYTTYLSGEMDALITPFMTWLSTTWDKSWQQYLYVNTSQVPNNLISWTNINIITLYLKPTNATSWDIDFYIKSGWNWDDSTIASWISNNTQFIDILTQTDTWHYTISWYQFCSSKPYIQSWIYQQYTYISTNTWVQKIRTGIPALNNYPQTWDNQRIDLLQTTWRTIRTNTSVLLTITWNIATIWQHSWINILSTNILNLSQINWSWDVTTWWIQKRQFHITWNIYTGALYFENIYWNSWRTYQSGSNLYIDDFYVNVFRYDTIKPFFNTGYVTWQKIGETTYILSWWVTTGGTPDFHAARSIMDDQYKVINFSWTNPINQNCENLWYSCTTTGYADYMNTTWYVRTTWNDFQLLHQITFNNSFEGYITVIDRAGNTENIFVDINLEPEATYWLIVYPKWSYNWWNALARQTYTKSGMLVKIAIYKQDLWWLNYNNYKTCANVVFDNLVYTWFLKTSTTWRATFTGSFSSGKYDVLVGSIKWLSVLYTWIHLDTIWWTIDYRNLGQSWLVREWNVTNLITPGIDNSTTYKANYHANPYKTTSCETTINNASTTTMQNDDISIPDLAGFLSSMERYNDSYYDDNSNINKIWIYSWSFFADIDDSWWSWLRLNKLQMQEDFNVQNTMVYWPYDFNWDWNTNIADYWILNEALKEYNDNSLETSIRVWYYMPF